MYRVKINCDFIQFLSLFFHGWIRESKCDFYSSSFKEPSLYTVKAIAILDNDGERVVAKVRLRTSLNHNFLVSVLFIDVCYCNSWVMFPSS